MSDALRGTPFTLHHGDARNMTSLLQRMARSVSGDTSPVDESRPTPFIQATITSPPYGNLVDYGVDGQIGHGQSEDEYLADCRAVFKTIYDWTRASGVLWIVADSFLDQSVRAGEPSRFRPLPFTLAHLAEAEGWTLREVVIWHKDRTLPWSHHGKLRNAFEYVLLLVKSKHFPFHIDRLRDPHNLARWWVQYPERYHAQGKSPDNVWGIPIPVQGSWANKAYQHACPLPVELVRRMLELTTEPDDIVFDPFGGIGTVVATANALSRRGFGTELNRRFVTHYEDHVRGEIDELVRPSGQIFGQPPKAETIAMLRALKFPKLLFAAYRRARPDLQQPFTAIVDVPDPSLAADGNTLTDVTWLFVADADPETREEMQGILKDLSRYAPFSKFGVVGDIRVVDRDEADRVLAKSTRWFAYEHGKTWNVSQEAATPEVALAIPASVRRGRYIPVLGSFAVRIDLDTIGDPAADDPTR